MSDFDIGTMFQDAVRRKMRMSMLMSGPTGYGKTLSALLIGYGMTGDWQKVFVVDTENDSALAYANSDAVGVGVFKHLSFKAPFDHIRLVGMLKAMNAKLPEGSVVIIDSLSHFWEGKGGVREKHDNMGGNSFTNWNKAGEWWNEIIDFLNTDAKYDIIATSRQKMAHAQTEEPGSDGQLKKVVRRLGLDNTLRPATEYSFLLEIAMQSPGVAMVAKRRGTMLESVFGTTFRPAPEHGQELIAWAREGVDYTSPEQEFNAKVRKIGGVLNKHVKAALGGCTVNELVLEGRTVDELIERVKYAKDPKAGQDQRAYGIEPRREEVQP